MIICTSISPFHSNLESQVSAVKSWQQYGEVYSLNTKGEIPRLEPCFSNVTFIETDKTMEDIAGKPLVNINAFFEFAKGRNEDLLLINSDIFLSALPELKKDGITILSRHDYSEDMSDSKIFSAGFDGFYIPNNFLSIFPPSVYSLGAAWHDYFTPMKAILKGVPVYWPKEKFLFHKIHRTQYDYEQWILFGEYFRLDFKINKQLSVPHMATKYLNEIKTSAIII